ncbi:MAG: formylglycine-generating enzyme family protein, partial [Chloroflexia bacterium]|nr:formylglycine-generating enzyme family protein [Chloroflexia bacterium]
MKTDKCRMQQRRRRVMKTIRVSGLFGLSLLAVISVACAPAHNEPRIAPAKEDAGLKMEQPAQPEPSPQHVEAGTPAPSNPELNEAESSEAIAPTMVRIPGGCFQMGSPPDELGRDNERQHEICVEAFSIGKYEVTQAEWEAVMGSNPSRFSGCADCPVENVSWDEVQEYIGKLNADTGGGYRLPTEAEWE